MYYVGIDGGGTNSRLVGLTIDDKITETFYGKSTNLSSNTYDCVKLNIKELVNQFIDSKKILLNDIKGFCIGSAGIDTDEKAKDMERLLNEIGISCKKKVINDSELILAAETKGEEGYCIISGTGSIAFAVDSFGKTFRVGGWGHMIDDIGSGYYIGMQAIKYALMCFDKRCEHTMLLEKIKDHFKIDSIENVLNIIYSDKFNKSVIADITSIVKESSIEGDQISKLIEEKAADGLIEHIDSLVRQVKMTKCKVVLSGSIFKKYDAISDRVKFILKHKYKDLDIVESTINAEIGAAHIAKKICDTNL